jgi:hypothetical protein
MKFQLPVPSGWQYENSPAQFQMAAKDGKSMMLFTLAPGKTLDEAAQTVIKNYSLQVSENNKTTINGNPSDRDDRNAGCAIANWPASSGDCKFHSSCNLADSVRR